MNKDVFKGWGVQTTVMYATVMYWVQTPHPRNFQNFFQSKGKRVERKGKEMKWEGGLIVNILFGVENFLSGVVIFRGVEKFLGGGGFFFLGGGV